MGSFNSSRSWQEWLENADGYARAVSGSGGKPNRLSPAIQYNLVALALENYVMAMTHFHGNLPDNHTFTDLIHAWERVAPLDQDVKSVILKYEDMQSICSMEQYTRHDPSPEEVQELRKAVAKLGAVAKATCRMPQAAAKEMT